MDNFDIKTLKDAIEKAITNSRLCNDKLAELKYLHTASECAKIAHNRLLAELTR